MTNNGWFFKWTNIGKPGNSNYVAVFSASHMKTNILYTYKNLNEVLAAGTQTSIPHAVMLGALHSFLSEQVYGSIS